MHAKVAVCDKTLINSITWLAIAITILINHASEILNDPKLYHEKYFNEQIYLINLIHEIDVHVELKYDYVKSS